MDNKLQRPQPAMIEKGTDAIRELTRAEVGDILFWSFYYSQGSPDVQGILFKGIALLKQNLRLPSDYSDDELIKTELPRYLRFFLRGAHTNVASDKQEQKDKLENWLRRILIAEAYAINQGFEIDKPARSGYEEKLKEFNDTEAIEQRLHISWYEAHVARNFLIEWHAMKAAFERNFSSEQTWDSISNEILQGMINQDYYKLLKEEKNSSAHGGDIVKTTRPTAGKERLPAGPFAPTKSHFFSYIVNCEQGPGPEILQELINTIREKAPTQEFANSLNVETALTQLYHLSNKYNFTLGKLPHIQEKFAALNWKSPAGTESKPNV